MSTSYDMGRFIPGQFYVLTKSSSYVLSSTYSGQKDNTVMCLQEVLQKRWIISLQSAEAYLRRREIGKRKKRKALGFPLSTVHLIISILIGILRQSFCMRRREVENCKTGQGFLVQEHVPLAYKILHVMPLLPKKK